jgi:hypothetical protein
MRFFDGLSSPPSAPRDRSFLDMGIYWIKRLSTPTR